MHECHPPVHTLVVRPETLKGVDTESVCERHHKHEQRKETEEPRALWPEDWVHECKREIRPSYDFDYYPKREVLARDEREEKRLSHYENNERKRENTAQDNKAQGFFYSHIPNIISPR